MRRRWWRSKPQANSIPNAPTSITFTDRSCSTWDERQKRRKNWKRQCASTTNIVPRERDRWTREPSLPPSYYRISSDTLGGYRDVAFGCSFSPSRKPDRNCRSDRRYKIMKHILKIIAII